MKILFLNHDGGGFADYIEVEEGKTVKEFFKGHELFQERESSDFLIRVNRAPVSGDHVLVEGDTTSITPTKIDGAE